MPGLAFRKQVMEDMRWAALERWPARATWFRLCSTMRRAQSEGETGWLARRALELVRVRLRVRPVCMRDAAV